MKKSNRGSIANRVKEQIRQAIADAKSEALPSIRYLAQFNACSTRTVRLIYESMVQKGELKVRPGLGYFASALPRMPAKQFKPKERWREVAERIRDDLRSALFLPAVDLPSQKELCQRYDVCVPTVGKALRALSAEGFLQGKGVHWRLPARSVQGNTRKVVRLLCSSTPGALRLETQREQEFMRTLVEESQRMGLELQVIGYEDRSEHPHFFSRGAKSLRLPKDPRLLGTIFSSWHMRDAGACLAMVARENLPVSIWWEGAHQGNVQRQFAKVGQRCFFDVGYGEEPGHTVGAYLHGLGHRRIAFLSPFHASDWSRERCRGLQRELQKTGGTLETWVMEEMQNPWTLRDQVIADTKWNQLPNALQTMFQTCGGDTQLTPWEELAPLKERAFDLAQMQRMRALLHPLFERVARKSQASAWVLANDLVGLMAQDFWMQSGTSVSRWPHLVAFDNTLESYVRGLDSYEFNTLGLVQQMLYHLVAPRHPQFSSGDVLHLQGRVICKGMSKPNVL